MTRARWLLMAALVILLALLLFGLPLYGPRLINQLPGDYTVRARSVGGPLWRPVLRGAIIDGPGIRGEADELELRVTSLNPFRRELRFAGRLRNAEIDLDLKQLLSGQQRSNWQFTPQDFALENVRVNLDNSGYSLPDARLSARGENGRLNLQAVTRFGGAKADVRYAPKGGQLAGDADVQFDATLINAFWPGIQGGKLTGRYTFDGGDLRGDLTVREGRVVVPGAEQVEIRDIAGTVRHRGSDYDLALSGQAWDGPVSARAKVDTAARHWTASGEASPAVAALARELDTTGEGQLRVTASAEGWDDPTVKAALSGQGEIASVPFEALRATYRLRKGRGEVQGSARTRLQGESQQVEANWTVGGAGRARATGRLLDSPLELQARLQGDDVRVNGRALNGPLSAAYNLQTRDLRATASVDTAGVKARVSARGPVSDLGVTVEQLSAGGLDFRGSGRLTDDGLRLDLGALSVRLDRQGQGSWQSSGLQAYGATLDGQGQVDLRQATLQGTLQARIPAVEGPLRGPLELNWRERQGQWTFQTGTASWRGEGAQLALRGLRVAGLSTRGNLSYSPGSLLGEVNAVGELGRFTLRGLGATALLGARVRGLQIQGETQLGDEYRTRLRLTGTELSGEAVLRDGVQFDLRSGGERLQGTLRGGQIEARGALDLRALRELSGIADLGGRFEADLRGPSGTGRLRAQARGAQVVGTFQSENGKVRGEVDARLGEVRAALRGALYPLIDARGTLSWQSQQVNAALSGTPGRLAWSVSGTTAAQQVAGIALPGQSLRASGFLTPELRGTGRWGALDLSYRDGRVKAKGSQDLMIGGEAARLKLDGELGPQWAGSVRASGTIGAYDVQAEGPWRNLRLGAQGAGFRATGGLDAATQEFSARVRGRLSGIFVDADVRGGRDRLQASGRAADPQGGFATFEASSPTRFRARFNGLRIQGLALQGDLSAAGAGVNGSLRVGDLRLTARQGALALAGEFAGTRLDGGARLTLPSTLSDIRLTAAGRWGTARLAGNAQKLRGQLELLSQEVQLQGTDLSLSGARLPLQGSLFPPSLQAGGLRFSAGVFEGAQALPYTLASQRGRLILSGKGAALYTALSGPIQGNVQVYPVLQGEVRAGLAPLLRSLPQNLRREVQPGQLRARLRGSQATLDLLGTRYAGEPLSLKARVNWQRELSVQGELSQPGSRLPFSLARGDLSVRDARLDARALRPFVTAQGQITGDLRLPGLDLARATGRVDVDLRAGEQAARGSVSLSRGQLQADLSSTLGDRPIRVRGPVYPRADASFSLGEISGTLRGQLPGELALRADGRFEGRAVTLQGALGAERLQISGQLAGADLRVDARRAAGRWQGEARVNIADLRELTGEPGQLSGVLSGTLERARGEANGTVAGARFSLPLVWAGGALSVEGGEVSTAQLAALVSGQVYPQLDLKGKADVRQWLPGSYTLRASGPLERPDLRVSGTLTSAVSAEAFSLDASGTRLNARLRGQDWLVEASGPALQGSARGQLKRGVLNAQFDLSTTVGWADGQLALQGPFGWNARTGWQGNLRSTGRAFGQATDLVASGNGTLNLTGSVGRGRVQASLPANLVQQPGGSVTLQTFDLGALWGRGGQLSATGSAALAGSWRAPQVSAMGDITDRGGDLSGRLSAEYAENRGRLDFAGWLDKVSAQASWEDGRYRALVRARDARLARLLPPSLEVSALRFSGMLEASGDRNGLTLLTARDLDLQGAQLDVGTFSARGELLYSPSSLSSNLMVRALGGELSAVGRFPQEVRVSARNLDARALGTLSGNLSLSGEARNPQLSGSLVASRPEVSVRAQLSGRLLSPAARFVADFLDPYQGRLTGELSELAVSPPSARLRVNGRVARGDERVDVDLAGLWPQLRGTVVARLPALDSPLQITGDGNGRYALSANNLASGQFSLQGFAAQLAGSARITPLGLLDAQGLSVQGSGALDLRVSGMLNDPQFSLSGRFPTLERSGVRLEDLTLSGGGSLQQFSLQARQQERTVATFDGQRLTVQGLEAQAFSSRFTTDALYTPDGALQGTVRAEGALSGLVRVGYAGGAASASGNLSASGARASFEVAGSQAVGWAGRGQLSGLPRDLITRDPTFTVKGAWDAPSLSAQLGLLGAEGRLDADTSGARLTVSDGPGTQADGELRLAGQALSGALSLVRDGARVKLALQGTLSEPRADVDAAFSEWSARGALSTSGGTLVISDGTRQGTLQAADNVLRLDLPGLDLARLGLQDYSGKFTARGTYDLTAQRGNLSASVAEARTPFTVPVLDIPVEGLVQLTASQAGSETRVNALLSSDAGRLALSATRQQAWSGQLSADLRRVRAGEAGTLRAELGLADGRINGTLDAAGYPLTLMGVDASLRAAVAVRDNQFDLNGSLSGAVGRVTLSGGGDLAGALEENFAALKLDLRSTGEGYQVDARLENLDLQALDVAPLLEGRLSGTATLSDGGSTFVLRSPGLRVAGQELPARLEGTSFGTEWRVRGFVGDSQLFGSVTSGELSGRLELTSLPVGAILSAVSGPLPGQGTVSGLARFTLPLADPLAGRIDVVAERIRVSAGTESLTGTGTLAYAARELRNVNVQLRGAGDVNIQGEYSRARVDVRATLRNTSFTPFLSIVPGLRNTQPSLRGDLEARIGGTYDVPDARLTGGTLSGSLSNVRFTLAELNASLSNGQLQGGSSLRLEGEVAASGSLTGQARLVEGRLEGSSLRYDGDLATRATGRLQRIVAEVLQSPTGWNLDSTVVQGGTARITGSLSPALRLTASLRALTPQLGLIYARDSLLNGDLTIEEKGSDFEVGGALTFERLVIGRVSTPSGLTLPGAGEKIRNGENFVSPLPTELVTFPAAPGEQRSSPLLSRIVLRDIPVLMPNGIRIDENLARAELAGSLLLAGRASEPQVSGQIRVVRGSLFLRENEFSITEGSATFDGSSAYPTFQAAAQGRVPDENVRVGVSVNVEGSFPAGEGGERALDLRTTFSCTVNCTRAGRDLSESELYALVALGSSNASNLPSELTQSALRTTLNVFLLGELERGVGRALGLDVFRIRTNLLSAASDFQVQFTLGSYVTRDFYLEYQVDLRGEGLVNAIYTTPDNLFTFTASSPVSGLNLNTLQPSLAVAYNFTPRSSVQFGVTTGPSTTFRLGYTFRF